jgi:hypothetical protein
MQDKKVMFALSGVIDYKFCIAGPTAALHQKAV